MRTSYNFSVIVGLVVKLKASGWVDVTRPRHKHSQGGQSDPEFMAQHLQLSYYDMLGCDLNG